MKTFYTLLFLLIYGYTYCQEKEANDSLNFLPKTLTAIKNGELLDPKTFGGFIPKAGDNIVIPKSISVSVSGDINFNNVGDGATTIYNAGELTFGPKGKLQLGIGSVYYGTESSFLNREGKENVALMKIGNVPYFGGQDSLIEGTLIFPTNISPEAFLNVTTLNKNHTNIVNWATIRECKIKSFEVYRSSNGISWELVNQVPAVGNSRTLHTYMIQDTNVTSPICYYRIKEIDESARGQFSFIRSVKNIEQKDNLSSR